MVEKHNIALCKTQGASMQVCSQKCDSLWLTSPNILASSWQALIKCEAFMRRLHSEKMDPWSSSHLSPFSHTWQ